MSWRDRLRRIVRHGGGKPALAAFEREGFAALREEMVRDQIERRGVTDARVLAAMRRVERERFLPPHAIDASYDDRAVRIGQGQTISQPFIVARMTELLELEGDEKVLEVGTGSGYQAAILGELARDVFTIELLSGHHETALRRLAELEYRNIHCVIGDGAAGLPDEAPFDSILVAAAPREVPPALIEQLKDGGRLVIPLGVDHQDLVLFRRRGSGFERTVITPVQFVPLVSP